MKRLSFACLAAAMTSLCACSSPSSEIARNVSGTVLAPQGKQIDQVFAVSEWDSQTQTYTQPDETGHFRFLVYDRGSLRISLMDSTGVSSVVHFPRHDGIFTSVMHISAQPAVHLTPKNGAGPSDEPVKIVYETADIDLGTVKDTDGDGLYEASNNPLGQVDFDGDGLADLFDSDVDGDGLPDVSDNDLDNDGADDATENNDKNNDGFPDEGPI